MVLSTPTIRGRIDMISVHSSVNGGLMGTVGAGTGFGRVFGSGEGTGIFAFGNTMDGRFGAANAPKDRYGFTGFGGSGFKQDPMHSDISPDSVKAPN